MNGEQIIQHDSPIVTTADKLDSRVRKTATERVKIHVRFNAHGARFFTLPSAGLVQAPTVGDIPNGKIDSTRWVEVECYPHEVTQAKALVEDETALLDAAQRAYERKLFGEVSSDTGTPIDVVAATPREQWREDWKRVLERTPLSVEAEFHSVVQRHGGRSGIQPLAEVVVVSSGIPLPKPQSLLDTEFALGTLAREMTRSTGVAPDPDAMAKAFAKALAEAGLAKPAGDSDEVERLRKEAAGLREKLKAAEMRLNEEKKR